MGVGTGERDGSEQGFGSGMITRRTKGEGPGSRTAAVLGYANSSFSLAAP